MNYTEINAKTWDRWAEGGCEWSVPITHEEYMLVNEQNYTVYLTPCIPVPHEWFGSLAGKQLLGLASGGGQQMPVFAKLGAVCTVFDNSEKQLEAERITAAREGYSLEIIRGDMTKPLPFADNSFDTVFHPVSNCYAEEILPIWRECARILKPGGRLLAGFSNGIDFLFKGDDPLKVVNPLPYNPLKMPEEQLNTLVESNSSIQFSHSLEEQIGGQLKAGLTLKDLYEDRDRENGAEIRKYASQYMATFSVK